MWPLQDLCVMLGQRVWDPLLLLPRIPGGDWLTSSYFHGSTKKSRSDGKKLSIPSTSGTPAARHGAPSIKLLAGPDTPPPVPHFSKIRHFATVKSGAHKTRDCESTRLINKKVSDLWKVPTLEEDGNFPRVYTLCRISSPIWFMRFLHFLHVPTPNSQDLEKSTSSCDP